MYYIYYLHGLYAMIEDTSWLPAVKCWRFGVPKAGAKLPRQALRDKSRVLLQGALWSWSVVISRDHYEHEQNEKVDTVRQK